MDFKDLSGLKKFCLLFWLLFLFAPCYADTIDDEDAGILPYERMLPQWGVQFEYAFSTFTNSPTLEASTVVINALALQLDFQPAFLQKLGYGILGVGITGSFYPTTPAGVLTQSTQNFFSYGTQLKYQGRFVLNQVVVPVIGYGVEFLEYQFIGGTQNPLFQFGPLVGLYILLNHLDTRTAKQFYKATGIKRTYFVMEAKATTSGDQTLPWSPATWYFGLRVEF